MYAIKRVWFGVMRVGVVTQEDNGPCPIIAIANTLLLRGAISLPSTQSAISHRGLVKLLADYARDINRVPPGCEHGGMSAEIAANIEANLASSMHVLNGRAMRYGMDINCSLTSVSGFEFTEEIGVFDLFRIRPLHGWIASPDEEELHDFFSGRSYNQVQDAVCLPPVFRSGPAGLPMHSLTLLVCIIFFRFADCTPPRKPRALRGLDNIAGRLRGGRDLRGTAT